MKKADKPAGKSSAKKSSGFKTAQAVEKVKANVKSSKENASQTSVVVKKKEVLNSATSKVEKSSPKTTKKSATTTSTAKRTRVKAGRKKTTLVPDLNNPGYPQHPTRIWPD